MLISSVSLFSHSMTTTKLRNNTEERMRIEGNLQKELDAVKANSVFINHIFGITRCSNLWRR